MYCLPVLKAEEHRRYGAVVFPYLRTNEFDKKNVSQFETITCQYTNIGVMTYIPVTPIICPPWLLLF